MNARVLLVVVMTSCASVNSVAPPPVAVVRAERPKLRLPEGIKPTSYALHATIIPGEATFRATLKISVALSVRTDRVWLNADNIELNGVKVRVGDRAISADARLEPPNLALIELSEPIGPGEAIIELETRSPISEDEEGVIFGVENGRTYVYSNFEPTGARRAFALFDEPGFKVPWQVTLTVPVGMVALSNTAIERETIEGAMSTVVFARTTPLPSYLVAFAVGPFDVIDAGLAGKNQVPVRIVVPRGQGARADFAVANTKEAVERLEAWFGSPIPYRRVDLVTVTSPAFGGAMENPGLITFAESLLLRPVMGNPLSRERFLLSTIIHELAHQWFGNLVTAAWWDDLWLNEAFADFVASDVLQAWMPGWHEEIERTTARDFAMNSDMTLAARRVREPIATHDDISGAFDTITYSKGSAVLAMFEGFVGRDVFRTGVRSFLADHAQGNATMRDFVKAMNTAAGRDVSAPLLSFLDQPGVPMISGELKCTSESVSVIVKQERYSPLGSTLPPLTWKVPVCLKWDGGKQCTVLETASAEVTLPTKKCPTWLLLNDEMRGYYRSRPSPASLISNGALSINERLGAAYDLVGLVQRGDASIVDELEMVPAAVASDNRALIELALGVPHALAQLVNRNSRKQLAIFTQRNFGAKWKTLGLTPKVGEGDDARLLRPLLFNTLAGAGEDKALNAAAVQMVRGWLKGKPPAPEMLSVAIRVAGRANDLALFEEELRLLPAATEREYRGRLLNALGAVTDRALAIRALDLILRDDLDPRETLTIFWSLAGRNETRDMLFGWLKVNFEKLVKAVPEAWGASLIQGVAGFCSRERRAEIAEFFEPRMKGLLGGPREFANAMESYDQCTAWREKQVPAAEQFLR